MDKFNWYLGRAIFLMFAGFSGCAATSDLSIQREIDSKVRSGAVSGAAAARLYEDGAERYLARGDKSMAADMLSSAALYWDKQSDDRVEIVLDRCDSLGMKGSPRTAPCDFARQEIAEARAKRGGRPLPSSTQSVPSFMPPMALYPSTSTGRSTPPVDLRVTQTANSPQRQTRGFERTYCVQVSLLRNDTPSPNTLHVKFLNSCPIAVVIGWSARMPDGSFQGGEGSGVVPPGGTYNTFLLQKAATGVRHIACSSKAAGFRAVASESDWYCSPGGD